MWVESRLRAFLQTTAGLGPVANVKAFPGGAAEHLARCVRTLALDYGRRGYGP